MKNKTVIVTGSASGIGKAAAELFAQNGANVVVSDLQTEAGQAVVDKIIENGGKASFLRAEVSKPEDMEALVAFAVKTYGRLGKSEEVAELIYWLGSDKSSFVTGSYYPVDGGYLAR